MRVWALAYCWVVAENFKLQQGIQVRISDIKLSIVRCIVDIFQVWYHIRISPGQQLSCFFDSECQYERIGKDGETASTNRFVGILPLEVPIAWLTKQVNLFK